MNTSKYASNRKNNVGIGRSRRGPTQVKRCAAGSRVRLDLNSPEFLEVFFRLDVTDLRQVVASLGRLHGLDWNALYRHTGFQWELIEHVKGPNGAKVDSLRLSQRIRAIALRDGDFLRLTSLHPDHDSAYKR